MNPISSLYRWQRITPEDDHYFFGYYDRCPWDPAQVLHLTMRVGQCERLPERGETADIGTVDRGGNYRKLVTTRTWCHQQGAMELFLPRHPGRLIYNDFDEASGHVVCRVFEIGRGIVDTLKEPVYSISPDGRYAASLDFARIPRRGYSYADAVLSADAWPRDPDHAGLRLIDLETGESRMIASYRRMIAEHPFGYELQSQRIWLNHAIFNCDGTRILWLFRQAPVNYDPRTLFWKTFMYTAKLDGSDTRCILPEGYWDKQISHQIWGRTPHEVLVDANWTGSGHHAIVFDDDRLPFIARKVADSHGRMAHMVFSPDGSKLLADSYPDENGRQTLALIDCATGKMEIIGIFNHRPEKPGIGETRCDLHPRWSRDGKTVTVDSIHDGRHRGIYLLEL